MQQYPGGNLIRCAKLTRFTHNLKLEDKLSALLTACRPLGDSLPYPLLLIGPDGVIYDADPAAAALLGHSITIIRGRPVFELLKFTLPETHRSLMRRVVEERIPQGMVDAIPCDDGNCTYTVQYALLESQVLEPPIVVCTLQEVEAGNAGIDHQAHATRALAILHESNRTLQLHEDEQQIYRELCRIAVDACGYRMAWIGLKEPGEDQLLRAVAWHGEGADYVEWVTVSWGTGPYSLGPGGIAIRSGQPAVVGDVHTDPSFAAWRDMAETHGFNSVIALPVTVDDQIIGAFGIYASATHAFDALVVGILEELMHTLDFRLSSLPRSPARGDFGV